MLRKLQQERKALDLKVEDRVRVRWYAEGAFADAVAAQFGRGSRASGGQEDEEALMEVVCYRVVK